MKMLKKMLLRPTQRNEVGGEPAGLVSEEEIMRRHPPVRCLPPQQHQETTGTADPANLFFAPPLPLLPAEVRER
jgi:hypothetical protein